MKITSSTSITSTYGTMLISFMRRRARIASGPRRFVRAREPRLGLPLQDVGELLHEALEAHGEAVDPVGEAAAGHDGREPGGESDRPEEKRPPDFPWATPPGPPPPRGRAPATRHTAPPPTHAS